MDIDKSSSIVICISFSLIGVMECDLYWRISFSYAEKILILHANNGNTSSQRKYIFKMLKNLMHKVKEQHPDRIKKFASYHLKMFMLNEYDRRTKTERTDKKTLLLDTIERLLNCLHKDPPRHYPKILNYFIRNDNVVRHVPENERNLIFDGLMPYLTDWAFPSWTMHVSWMSSCIIFIEHTLHFIP